MEASASQIELYPPEEGEGDFLIVVLPAGHGASCEFKAYLCAGIDDDGTPLYRRIGAVHSQDLVADFNQAEVYADGFLRFDGCLNLSFDNGGTMLHFCGEEMARKRLSRLIERIYEDACPAGWFDRLDR